MKRFAKVFNLAIILMVLLSFQLPANAASSDLKTSSYQSNFVFHNESIYYNNILLDDKEKGIYKVSANMKNFKLLKAGDFSTIKGFKNSLIVFDHDKRYAIQLSLDGKVMKEFPSVDVPTFEVYGNHLYFYDSEARAFYQLAVQSGKQTLLIHTPTTTVQEFTLHNGWLYYVHERYLDDDLMNSVEHLSKIKLTNPSKEVKVVKSVNNIDSVIVRDGYIYAVMHIKAAVAGRSLYRMDYSGKKVTRISKQDMGAGPFINGKSIYFVENSFNDQVKLYRMALDGKNVKAVATIKGRTIGAASNKNSMYFEVQNGRDFFLQRISVK